MKKGGAHPPLIPRKKAGCSLWDYYYFKTNTRISSCSGAQSLLLILGYKAEERTALVRDRGTGRQGFTGGLQRDNI